jgi:hypothetical protein
MSIVDIYMKSDLQVTRLSRCLYYEITYYDTNLHVLVENAQGWMYVSCKRQKYSA